MDPHYLYHIFLYQTSDPYIPQNPFWVHSIPKKVNFVEHTFNFMSRLAFTQKYFINEYREKKLKKFMIFTYILSSSTEN